jgi:uncharacterized protein YrrD
MKARSLLKKTVTCAGTGDIMGHVCDVMLDSDLNVTGLVVDLESGGKGTVPVEEFEIGRDAIIIRGPDCLRDSPGGNPENRYRERLGTVIKDNQGTELGILSDVVVEPQSKETEGVEVSSGILRDFVDGRSELPIGSVQAIEKDVLVVEEKGGKEHELPGL